MLNAEFMCLSFGIHIDSKKSADIEFRWVERKSS